MITFKEHIEISRYSQNEGGILEYIAKLPPEKRVRITRGITESYPLKMQGTPTDEVKRSFNIYTDVMELVLGQFIMLEQIITGKTQFKTDAENDLALAQLIMRPKHHKTFDNEDSVVEEQNKNNILNTPAQDVYDVLSTFLKNREFILFKQFSGVFYELPDEDEENEEGDDPTAEQLFSQQWYWYSMVRMLAKEDITKYEEIYMLKMAVVMPEMSYIAQKNKIESARQRQSEAMSRL